MKSFGAALDDVHALYRLVAMMVINEGGSILRPNRAKNAAVVTSFIKNTYIR